MLINDRPGKILILGEARAVHAQRWTDYFRHTGWTVRWLSIGPVPDGIPAESIADTRMSRLAAILRAVGNLRLEVERFQPDIVSALFIPDYGWMAAIADVHPLAVSAWGSDLLISAEKSPLHRWRAKNVLKHADHLFADADILRDRMLALGTPPDQITIVPLGVDAVWLEVGENRAASSDPPLTVLSNRRLEPLYRVETLIEAAAQLQQEDATSLRFIVIGEGSEHDRLLGRATSLGLADPMRFVPWLSADLLRDEFARCDIYVSTASSDGTSVSMLEAMAAGCFPVVTDLPANREWIESGQNGLLFPVGDSAQLAEQIRRAASDPSLREAARARNRKIIESRALWTDNMSVVEAAMLETIEQHRAGRGDS